MITKLSRYDVLRQSIEKHSKIEGRNTSMKKKILALLLAAAATVSLLSGCGANSGVMDTANANAVAGGNSDLPVVTWKMGSTWGAGNVHFTVDQRFGEILSQLCCFSLLFLVRSILYCFFQNAGKS